MTWTNILKGDSLSWVLNHNSEGVHYLALRDLGDLLADDPALGDAARLAHSKGPIAEILAEMQPGGWWMKPGPGYSPKYHSTVWSLILLAQLGANCAYDQRIAEACTYVLDNSLSTNGQFSCNRNPSGTIDCLQGNLCWALVKLGCNDPRLSEAFDWLSRSLTGKGIAHKEDRHSPLRYYAYKCGPGFACGANTGLPCAWGAAKVMLALGVCPDSYRSPIYERAVKQGVEFFFSVDPATAAYPTGNNDHPSRNWWKFGFPMFYVSDLLQIAEALAGLGVGNDPRLQTTRSLILEKQDKNGCWPLEYSYAKKTWGNYGRLSQPNPWVTLRALRFLKSTRD